MKTVFLKIKHFAGKLIAYFLPNPPTAPAGSPVVSKKGMKRILAELTIFFFLGILLEYVLNRIGQAGNLGAVKEVSTGNAGAYNYVSLVEIFLMGFFVIYYSLMPFLRYMYKWLKVTGSLYALVCGYLLCFMMRIVNRHVGSALMVSLFLALVLGALPLLLFKYRDFRLHKNVAKITYILFVVLTLGGSILKLFAQIPYVRVLTGELSGLSKYIGVQITIDIVRSVVAFLFLFLAYDRMRDYLSRKVSRKYEWLITFTGFYTISVIVLKINEIIGLLVAS